MDQFDEFAQGNLPPDPPSRAEAVEIVREAAARDPKFKQFLEKWFPVPKKDDVELRELGLDNRPALVDGFASQGAGPLQEELGRLLHSTYENSQNAHEHIIQLEQMQYQQMVKQAIQNHESYHAKRADAQLQLVRQLNKESELPLHDSEDLFNAVHFDLQAGREIDLDRVAEHSSSVKNAMKRMLEREVADVETQLESLRNTDHDSGQEDIIHKIKTDIIQSMQQTKEFDEQILEIKHAASQASSEQKTQARNAVYLKLLETLDEMVPESDAQESTVEASNASKTVHAQYDGLAHAQRELEQSLHQLNLVLQDTSMSTSIELSEGLLDQLRQIEIAEKNVPETPPLQVPDPFQAHASTSSIVDAFARIRKMEDKIKQDKVKSEIIEIQNAQAISKSILESVIVKRSTESPLLANRDLYGVDDLGVLSSAWHEASQQRTADSEIVFRDRVETITNQLNDVQKTLATAEQMMQDAESLKQLGLTPSST